jgi:hypothetical protein
MPELHAPELTSFAQSPAFPTPVGSESGITVRDWIATLALQGLAVNGLEIQADRHMTQQDRDQVLAKRAYGMADALLAERDQQT